MTDYYKTNANTRIVVDILWVYNYYFQIHNTRNKFKRQCTITRYITGIVIYIITYQKKCLSYFRYTETILTIQCNHNVTNRVIFSLQPNTGS